MRRPVILGILVVLLLLVVAAACSTSTPASTPSPSTTTTLTNPMPVDLVSALGPLPPYNPGGPVVEITLKNVSEEPVVSLSATLDMNRPFDLSFDVSPSRPLPPGRTVSVRTTLIGGAIDNIPDPLTIRGTMQSGATFSYIKKVYFTPGSSATPTPAASTLAATVTAAQ